MVVRWPAGQYTNYLVSDWDTVAIRKEEKIIG